MTHHFLFVCELKWIFSAITFLGNIQSFIKPFPVGVSALLTPFSWKSIGFSTFALEIKLAFFLPPQKYSYKNNFRKFLRGVEFRNKI
jgi:hypothetical protein